MYRIVTISREYGAGGLVIAGRVAEALGWELLDQSLVKHVADLAKVAPEEAAKVDECPSSWMERLSHSLWMGAPDSMAPGNPETFGADRAKELAAQLILKRANDGGHYVIVGRGSQCILHERRDVLKVFLHAPRELRVRQVRSQYGSDEEARVAIERIDRVRVAYVKQFFGCDMREASLYDLVINTKIGFDLATKIIVDTVGASLQAKAQEKQEKTA